MGDFVQWCGYGALPRTFMSEHAITRTFEFSHLDDSKAPRTFIAKAIAQARGDGGGGVTRRGIGK